MPTFTIPNPRVNPGTLPGVRVSANDLGYGQAAQAVNKGIQGITQQYNRQWEINKNETDQNRAMDIMNNARTQLTEGMHGEGGIMTQRGAMAVGSYDRSKDLVTRLKTEALDQAQNDKQRQMIERSFYRLEDSTNRSAITWENNQRELDREDTINSRRYRAVQGASESAVDPFGMTDTLRELDEIRQLDLQGGKNKQEVDDNYWKSVSTAHLGKLQRLAMLDPVKAAQFYEGSKDLMLMGEGGAKGDRENAEELVRQTLTRKAKNDITKASEECAAGRSPLQCAKKEAERQSQMAGQIPKSSLTTREGQRVDLDKAVKLGNAPNVSTSLMYATSAAETGGKFHSSATSPAGAEGAFQWMPETANDYRKEFGDFDPRNPHEASVMTARYHQKTYDTIKHEFGVSIKDARIFGAAYNCGLGCLQKAIRNAGSSQYDDFEQYLPKETRGYGKKIAKYSGATEEMPPMFGEAVEAGVQEGLNLVQSRDKWYNMQPSDPAAQQAYSAAYNNYMLNPSVFLNKSNAKIKEELDGKMPPSLIDKIVAQKGALTNDRKYGAAVAASRVAILNANKMYKGGKNDFEQSERYASFVTALDAELAHAHAATGGKGLSIDETTKLVNKMFVDVKLTEPGTLWGRNEVSKEYWELGGLSREEYQLDVSDEERAAAIEDLKVNGEPNPGIDDIYNVVMIARSRR